MSEHEKFDLLTSSVTVATRNQYMYCWRRWAQFSACSVVSPWIQTPQPGWDDQLLNFLVWENKLLGLQHSALTKRFYAIRYIHIAEGYDDFASRAHRIRGVLKAIKLRGKKCKKIPFNTDLLRWLKTNIPVHDTVSENISVLQCWAGLLLGFFFCLRISEILGLTENDIKFDEHDGAKTVSILIRGSKNDQEKLGVTRVLRATGEELCPVMAAYNYSTKRNSCNQTSPHWFNPNFRCKLTHIMKWAATSNNIPSDVVSTHSLRAGGATALFAAGVDSITIQRFGRWRSLIFHEYIWNGYSGFLHLGKGMATTTGLTKFLVEVAPTHRKTRFDPVIPYTTGGIRTTQPLETPITSQSSVYWFVIRIFGDGDYGDDSVLLHIWCLWWSERVRFSACFFMSHFREERNNSLLLLLGVQFVRWFIGENSFTSLTFSLHPFEISFCRAPLLVGLHMVIC